MPLKRKSKPVIVVHLGNVNSLRTAEKTAKYTKMFPNLRFVGIDRKKPTATKTAKNWKQIRADFENGLQKLKDNSVSIISSDFALGYYNRKGEIAITDEATNEVIRYTTKVLEVAHRKLKKGGKLIVVMVEKPVYEIMARVLKKAPFEQNKINIKPLRLKVMDPKSKPLIQITVEK